MDGPSHKISGAAVGATEATFTLSRTAGPAATTGDPWIVLGMMIATAATSSDWLSPDVDLTRPWIWLRQHSGPIAPALDHRETTHWPGWPILLWVAATIYAPPGWELAWHGFALGWLTHDVGDVLFGENGIPALPWRTRWRIKIGWLAAKSDAAKRVSWAFGLWAAVVVVWPYLPAPAHHAASQLVGVVDGYVRHLADAVRAAVTSHLPHY